MRKKTTQKPLQHFPIDIYKETLKFSIPQFIFANFNHLTTIQGIYPTKSQWTNKQVVLNFKNIDINISINFFQAASRNRKRKKKQQKAVRVKIYLLQWIQVINSSFSVNHERVLVHFNVRWAPVNNRIHIMISKHNQDSQAN